MTITSGECIVTDDIIVDKIIFPNEFLGEDISLCGKDSIQLGLEIPNATYLWQNGATTPYLTTNEAREYSLEILVEDCTTTDKVNITYQEYDCLDCNLFVPNAFSPNADGFNDQLEIFTNCEFSSYKLSIFNRWGALVFISNDPLEKWNGLMNGQLLNTGVYVISLEYKFSDAKYPDIFKGDITLMK